MLAVVTGRKLPANTGAGNPPVTNYVPQVKRHSDYYLPKNRDRLFGMEIQARTQFSSEYRYGFNGKENDRSWNSTASDAGMVQDYGFRLYNPAVGRFLSVDPLAPEYPWYTPYQFAGNMPIWAVDLDGL